MPIHRWTSTSRGLVLTLAVSAVLAGCRGRDDTPYVADTSTGALGGTTGVATPGDAPDLSGLTDPNILSVVGIINGEEILDAQAAEQRAIYPTVRAFAQDMISDHRALQQNIDSVALALDLAPNLPPVAEPMQSHMRAMRDSVTALTGNQFDLAYLHWQVQAHETAVSALRQMQTAADSTRLRQTLENATQTVQRHLERARALVDSLRVEPNR